MKLQKILVPLDGSALAEAALPKAVEMAESSGAKLLLIAPELTTFLDGLSLDYRKTSEGENFRIVRPDRDAPGE